MKFYRIFFLAIIINSLWGIEYDLVNKYNNNQGNRNLDFHTIIGIMVDFPYEEINDPNTTVVCFIFLYITLETSSFCFL